MRIKLLFLALIFSQSKVAGSQSISTSLGARTMGMGLASSTLADEWSLFNNIGGIGKINQASSNFTYEVKTLLTGANRLGASILIPTKVARMGLGISRFGDDLYSENLISLGFGNTIGNTSLGARANYIQYRIDVRG